MPTLVLSARQPRSDSLSTLPALASPISSTITLYSVQPAIPPVSPARTSCQRAVSHAILLTTENFLVVVVYVQLVFTRIPLVLLAQTSVSLAPMPP